MRSFWLMVLGRVAFGIGGGSLEVCQGKNRWVTLRLQLGYYWETNHFAHR
jgi:exopolyphosphatase/pppGpp-phosphohydrolase